ncbi:MAG: DUF6263 family protein [Armatimonadota bacterium]
MKIRLAAVITAAMLAAAVSVLAAGAVRLRVNVKPGDAWTYKVTVRNTGTMKGPQGTQPMNSTMAMTYRMVVEKKLPNGDYRAKFVPSSQTMSLNGRQTMKAQPEQLKPISFILSPTGKTRPLGEVGGPETASMTNIMSAVFPDKPVKVGDTWKTTQELPMGGGGNVKVTSTNRLVALSGNLAKVQTRFAAPISGDGHGGQGRMSGTMEGTITSELMLPSGMMKSASGQLRMRSKMTVPGPPPQQGGSPKPQTINIDMTISVSSVLVRSGK